MPIGRKTLAAMAKTALAEKKVQTFFKPERPGHFIKQWRKYRGMTQATLAERLDMSEGNLSMLENGKVNYTQPVLERIAEELRCAPGDLIMRDPKAGGFIWDIWDGLKPETRRRATKIVQALAEEDEAA